MDIELDRTKFHTWEFIWAKFMKSPRARAWLFSKEPPPKQHVFHSLQTHPKLLGFEFYSLDQVQRPFKYPYPDIGDLATVYTVDGHTLLGFNFGFRGLQPYIPPLQAVTQSQEMNNGKAAVRRFARRFVYSSEIKCFLAMEFSWLESGALTVSSCINPLPGHMNKKDYPYYDHMDFRFFNPSAAYRLSELNNKAPFNTPPAELPSGLLYPQEDFCVLRVREPAFPHPPSNTIDSNDVAAIRAPWPRPAHHLFDSVSGSEPTDEVSSPDAGLEAVLSAVTERDISSHSSGLTALPPLDGIRANMSGLWAVYRHAIRNAKPHGTYMSLIGRTVYSPMHVREVYSARYGEYNFMSQPYGACTRTKGRVQMLCRQLGLTFSSPVMDRPLLGLSGSEHVRPVSAMPLTGNTPTGLYAHGGVEHDGSVMYEDDVVSGYQIGDRYEEDSISGQHGQHVQHIVPERVADDIGADRTVQGRMAVGVRSENASFITGSTLGTGASVLEPGHAQGNVQVVGMNTEVLPGHVAAGLPPFPLSTVNEPVPVPSSGSYSYGISNHSTLVEGVPGSNTEQKHGGRDEADRSKCDETTVTKSDEDRSRRPRSIGSLSLPASSGVTGGGGTDDPNSIQELQGLDEKVKTEDDTEDDVLIEGDDKKENDGAQVGEKRKATSEADGAPESKWSNMIWTCDRCGAKIRGKRGNLNRHIASKHDNVRAFECGTYGCGRRFQTRLNLVRHVTAVHEGRPFACTKCPRAFKADDDREAHYRTAHLQCGGRLSCSICGGCFGRRSTLNRHMANVHKVRYVA